MKTDPRPLAVMNKLQSMDSIKILGVVVLYHSGNTADGDHRTSCDAISRGCLTGNGQSSWSNLGFATLGYPMLPPTKHKGIIINNRCNYEVTIADFPAGWTDMSSFEIPDHGHGDMGLLFSEVGVALRRSISEAGIQRIHEVRSTGIYQQGLEQDRGFRSRGQMHERK